MIAIYRLVSSVLVVLTRLGLGIVGLADTSIDLVLCQAPVILCDPILVLGGGALTVGSLRCKRL